MKKYKNTYFLKAFLAFALFFSSADYVHATKIEAQKRAFAQRHGFQFLTNIRNDTEFAFDFNNGSEEMKLVAGGVLELPATKCNINESVKASTLTEAVQHSLCDIHWRAVGSRTKELRNLGIYDGFDKDGKSTKANLALQIEGDTIHLVVIH